MTILKRTYLVSVIIILFSCRFFQPTAYFFIVNESKDKPKVDIKVIIAADTLFNDTIKYINVRPDLQYTPYKTLSKGKYTITAIADSGRAILNQEIVLESDRWIFVTYFFNNPIDPSQKDSLLKYFGPDTSFTNPKLRGTPSKLGIMIMDKEPVHM